MKFKRHKDEASYLKRKYVYKVMREGKPVVSIISKTLLFEEQTLDYYAEVIGVERKGLVLVYDGKCLEIIE